MTTSVFVIYPPEYFLFLKTATNHHMMSITGEIHFLSHNWVNLSISIDRRQIYLRKNIFLISKPNHFIFLQTCIKAYI